jgi:hypothetical protein
MADKNLPEKKKYKVLDANAHFVAGERIAADRTVELFEAAARYELLAGNLEEIGPAKAKKPDGIKTAVEG